MLCRLFCWSVGRKSSPKLEGTSIAVSIDTLKQCKLQLRTLGVDATIRALYIEKDRQAFSRLQSYLLEHSSKLVKSDCRNGDFIDLREDILEWCGTNAFTFFFIDPKGWKDIGVETLSPLLRRPRSEFLINFMYSFINRAASMEDQNVGIAALLGADVNVRGLIPAEREAVILDTYRTGLKREASCSEHGYRPRTAHVRVLEPMKERVKYHLVYLTSHPKGVIAFMEISEHVDLVQKQVRAEKRGVVRARETLMEDMFGDTIPLRSNQKVMRARMMLTCFG